MIGVALVQAAIRPANLSFHASPFAVALGEAKAQNTFGLGRARIRVATGAVGIWSPGWVISRRTGFLAACGQRIRLCPQRTAGDCVAL
jgi:hypothetical protein